MNSMILIGIYLILFAFYQHASIAAHSETSRYNLFARKLLSVISENRTTQNIVYSPSSIYNFLTILYYDARGRTAKEIEKALVMSPEDVKNFAANKSDFLRNTYKKTELKASKDFVIENFLRTKDNDETVLVNAIDFKPNWLQPFNVSKTFRAVFDISCVRSAVDVMFNMHFFKYAKLPELNAEALEIPYKNTDISLLIILPNEIGDLHNLERALAKIDLNDIFPKMFYQFIRVFIPRFRIKFDIDLKEPLERMGCSSMFKSSASFSGLVKHINFRNIKHQAFIDVNEYGIKANASSFFVGNNNSETDHGRVFRADRPFVFFIRSETEVYFTGHVGDFLF